MIRGCLNGETRMDRLHASVRESIACGGEPPELKHLSRARKRKKDRFRKQWRANAKEAKPERVRSGVSDRREEAEPSRMVLGKPAKEGESPVSER